MKVEEINVELKVDTKQLIKRLREANRELDKIRGIKKDEFDSFAFTIGMMVGLVMSLLGYVLANL